MATRYATCQQPLPRLRPARRQVPQNSWRFGPGQTGYICRNLIEVQQSKGCGDRTRDDVRFSTKLFNPLQREIRKTSGQVPQNQSVRQPTTGQNHLGAPRISDQMLQLSCSRLRHKMGRAAQQVIDSPASFNSHSYRRAKHFGDAVLSGGGERLTKIEPVIHQLVHKATLNGQAASRIEFATTIGQLTHKQIHQGRPVGLPKSQTCHA